MSTFNNELLKHLLLLPCVTLFPNYFATRTTNNYTQNFIAKFYTTAAIKLCTNSNLHKVSAEILAQRNLPGINDYLAQNSKDPSVLDLIAKAYYTRNSLTLDSTASLLIRNPFTSNDTLSYLVSKITPNSFAFNLPALFAHPNLNTALLDKIYSPSTWWMHRRTIIDFLNNTNFPESGRNFKVDTHLRDIDISFYFEADKQVMVSQLLPTFKGTVAELIETVKLFK